MIRVYRMVDHDGIAAPASELDGCRVKVVARLDDPCHTWGGITFLEGPLMDSEIRAAGYQFTTQGENIGMNDPLRAAAWDIAHNHRKPSSPGEQS